MVPVSRHSCTKNGDGCQGSCPPDALEDALALGPGVGAGQIGLLHRLALLSRDQRAPAPQRQQPRLRLLQLRQQLLALAGQNFCLPTRLPQRFTAVAQRGLCSK